MESSKATKKDRRYWAILCNPERYPIEKAINSSSEGAWPVLTLGQNPQPGDRLLLWKAKGKTDWRGVVALGEVLTAPAVIPPHPQAIPFLDNRDKEPKRRIIFRYVKLKAPFKLGDEGSEVLAELSVKNGQGTNKLYKVSDEQWHQLVMILGGWPDDYDHIQKVSSDASLAPEYDQFDDPVETEFTTEEGRERLRKHLMRERSIKLIKIFKSSLTSYDCVVCGFNFEEKYGEKGAKFIEAHHTKPIHLLKQNEKVSTKDLIAVCSNCHRIIHRENPMLEWDKLRRMLTK